VGDRVKVGQRIGEPTGFVSTSIHASISGTVIAIEKRAHPSGGLSLACVIESDGKDEWIDFEPKESLRTREEICDMLQEAGIVGLGGAAFPTHVKLSPPPTQKIDLLVLNGAECEPYLTADYRLMLEKPLAVLKGAKLFARALSVSRGFIAIEDNKPDALACMEKVADRDPIFKIRSLPTRYPQGGEKQLIQELTGREVPSGGLPMNVGVVVQNVGTAFAAFEAGHLGKPLVERVLTVTGEGVTRPANLMVRLGTSLEMLLKACGMKPSPKRKVILGGPMMGIAQMDLQVPVTKGTSGVLVLSEEALPSTDQMPCIRCGRCVRACPMGLLPCELGDLCRSGLYEEADRYGLRDCIECGCCAYICPAKLPLVQFIRQGKVDLREHTKKKEVA